MDTRSLLGYSPWGHRESDTTERLNTAHSMVMVAPTGQTEDLACWFQYSLKGIHWKEGILNHQ